MELTLRGQLTDVLAGGDTAFGPLESGIRYGGREVLRYTQSRPGASTVDWYVVVAQDLQLSVGCEHPAEGPDVLTDVCERAVRTVRPGAG